MLLAEQIARLLAEGDYVWAAPTPSLRSTCPSGWRR